MNHSHDAPERPQRDRRFDFAMLVLIGIVGFFLLTEHRAHALGVLPFAILLLCPLHHVFMHRGHGNHGDGDQSQRHHHGGGDSTDGRGWRDD